MTSDAIVILVWIFSSVILVCAGPLVAWKYHARSFSALTRPNFGPSLGTFTILSCVFILLAGTSGWLFQVNDNNAWSTATTLICVYMGLNFLFYPVFFIFRSLTLAFASMTGAATLSIIASIWLFSESDLCGWLFLPSVIWSIFMSYLSLTIMLNNRSGSVSLKKVSRRASSSRLEAILDIEEDGAFDDRNNLSAEVVYFDRRTR
jgi:tryptophan-rich sensory protein